MSTQWTRDEAFAICTLIHAFSPSYGCYVALTGGLLYKDGPRKDLDLVFYRIRQEPGIDKKGLFTEMEQSVGIKVIKGFGFCHKALLNGEKTIDLLFPEEDKVCGVISETGGGISGEPIHFNDPNPDPKPADVLVAAVMQGQCAQGVES